MEDQTCDQTRENLAGQVRDSENKVHTFSNSKFKTLFKIKQGVTNRYFRYSMKIDSKRLKSIIIYRLISKIDGN